MSRGRSKRKVLTAARKTQGLLPIFAPTADQLSQKQLLEEQPIVSAMAQSMLRGTPRSIGLFLAAVRADRPLTPDELDQAWYGVVLEDSTESQLQGIYGGIAGMVLTTCGKRFATSASVTSLQGAERAQLLEFLNQFLKPHQEYLRQQLEAHNAGRDRLKGVDQFAKKLERMIAIVQTSNAPMNQNQKP